jgi:hypothetical protein
VLKRILDPLSRHVVDVRGPIDWDLVPDRPKRPEAERVHIVYATGRQQDSIGAMLVAPLRRVLDEHVNVDLTLWGPRLRGLSDHPRVRHRARIADYDRYFAALGRAGFDIGLAPLPDDAFHRCKTNIKFREYGACRIAGVYADTEVYRDGVIDGETGLLVPQSEAGWVDAVSRLVRDEALRRRIRDRAHAYLRTQYPAGQMEATWLEHIEYAAATHTGPERSRRAAAATSPSRGALAMAVGIVKQALRYAARTPALLRSSGVAEVWTRSRMQLANFHQLMLWELALRRMHRRPERGAGNRSLVGRRQSLNGRR